jgi:hypothetical protein
MRIGRQIRDRGNPNALVNVEQAAPNPRLSLRHNQRDPGPVRLHNDLRVDRQRRIPHLNHYLHEQSKFPLIIDRLIGIKSLRLLKAF